MNKLINKHGVNLNEVIKYNTVSISKLYNRLFREGRTGPIKGCSFCGLVDCDCYKEEIESEKGMSIIRKTKQDLKS